MVPGTFEKWLSDKEASAALAEAGIDIKPKTLADRGRTGKLPSAKLNGKRKYRLSALLAHFEEQAARGE